MSGNYQNELSLLYKLLFDLSEEYLKQDPSVDEESRLTAVMKKFLPDHDEEELHSFSAEVFASLRRIEELKEDLKKALNSGISREEWFARKIFEAESFSSDTERLAAVNSVKAALKALRAGEYYTGDNFTAQHRAEGSSDPFVLRALSAETLNDADAASEDYVRYMMLGADTASSYFGSEGEGREAGFFEKLKELFSDLSDLQLKALFAAAVKIAFEKAVVSYETLMLFCKDMFSVNPLDAVQQAYADSKEGLSEAAEIFATSAEAVRKKASATAAGFKAAAETAAEGVKVGVSAVKYGAEKAAAEVGEVKDTMIRAGKNVGETISEHRKEIAGMAGTEAAKYIAGKGISLTVGEACRLSASACVFIGSMGIDCARTAIKLHKGDIDTVEAGNEIGRITVSTITGTLTGAQCAAAGSAVGMALGPVGAVVGGFLGGTVGYFAGEYTGAALFDAGIGRQNDLLDGISTLGEKIEDTVSGAYKSARKIIS